MDKPKQDMDEDLPRKEIQNILKNQNLEFYRKKVNRLVLELNLDVQEYAAALVCFIEQERRIASTMLHAKEKRPKKKKPVEMPLEMKMVRYRLDVGRKHHVSVDEIKKILIEESGVEKSRVGKIELHIDYCIVSLPSGMPTDIFFHLKTVLINQQELKISRLGGKNINFRKKSRQRSGRRKFQYSNNDPLKKEK
jgi:hypothetical protein